MKIDTSTVTMAATHSASSRDEVRETLRAWVGDRRPDFEAAERTDGESPSVHVTLSSAARQAQKNAAATQATSEATAPDEVSDAATDETDRDPALRLIKLVVEMLTGTKIKVHSAADITAALSTQPPSTASAAGADQQPKRAGFGIEYERHEVHSETEQTTFHAHGVIRTSDGKEIGFDLALAMQRSFTEQTDISLRAGDAVRKDPLVINFGGTATQLQSTRFSFDLDSDGKAENVPLLSGTSGYLALDRNGNGKVDSGSELFGARSGDGFAELAAYDSDGNGWIDENDPVFSRLQVWAPQADGSSAPGTLATLAQRGVGALMLMHADTPFEIRDANNQTLGAVRASGVYLSENGNAGTLQQIDLVV